MALSPWQKFITDKHGNVLNGASVKVLDSAGADATIFSDRAGLTSKANPFTTASNGKAEFYAAGGTYKVSATSGGQSVVFENQQLGTARELDRAADGGTVPERNRLETITENWLFSRQNKSGIGGSSLNINNANPGFGMRETDGPVDEKDWDQAAVGGQLRFRAFLDDRTGPNNWLEVNRTGNVIDSVNFPAPLQENGQRVGPIESGTWTPVLQGGTTSGSFTYDVQEGGSKRIGGLAFVNFWLDIASIGSAPSGTLEITGLPIALATSVDGLGVSLMRVSNFTMPSDFQQMVGRLGIVSGKIVFEYIPTTGGPAVGFPSANVGSNFQIGGSLVYEV